MQPAAPNDHAGHRPKGASAAGAWHIRWSTLDSGGLVATAGGAWGLSGTIGQWDVDAAGPQAGGGWLLLGGFWAVGATTTSETLFVDGFEER